MALQQTASQVKLTIDLSLWSDEFRAMTQSQRNHTPFNAAQTDEVKRVRALHVTPKEIAAALGIGVYKVHKVLNCEKNQRLAASQQSAASQNP